MSQAALESVFPKSLVPFLGGSGLISYPMQFIRGNIYALLLLDRHIDKMVSERELPRLLKDHFLRGQYYPMLGIGTLSKVGYFNIGVAHICLASLEGLIEPMSTVGGERFGIGSVIVATA